MTFIVSIDNLIALHRQPRGKITPSTIRIWVNVLACAVLFGCLLCALGEIIQCEKPRCKELTDFYTAMSRYSVLENTSFERKVFRNRSTQSLLDWMYSVFFLV